ncbi:DNA gyrase subunit A [Thioflexithrix psekupsensis]|uniref:DNA gyrase subunit A n=1 Tax=Thioflexithrix psekupsensis TaxID=1570016 RepID=A0A251XAL1_9GAMM|nr:DNA gyrase subunit A [Thioflexithrix psekupsensis]OUD15011.1 DNA gyrase subunit A [Thioflexithrix psekupsensis]
MGHFAKEIQPVNIEDEMRQSYLDYAMSVIVGRALPDVRDGLKPVHRRALYAMHELGNDWNKAYKKSARIVGDVIGKYHPHGDSAVYDTIVRMAQPFSLRYLLVDGQGNFGSVDGDAPAAMRYTEIRMSKIAHELLADIEKETVNFVPNYDESESEPSVFPTRIPNLLVNGSSGIAVGMATNIPPHNLREVINACLHLIQEPNSSIETLMRLLPGPDFPTAAIINGAEGINEAYRTGRGRIYIRAKTNTEIDEQNNRERLIITELPYQVNKARLIEKIAELIKEKKLEGIAELRDESDKDGIRVVLELRRGESADVVLNNLYQHTQLQSVFGINMVALVDGQPRLLNLKQLLELFLRHRREVVTRRTLFELRKARERAHILEGLAIALGNIEAMIQLIRQASTPAQAREQLLAGMWQGNTVALMLQGDESGLSRPQDLPDDFGLQTTGYRLSDAQAQAILDLRLHRLTGLEQDKLLDEYRQILLRIGEYLDILRNPERLMAVIQEELISIRETYGDERRSQILAKRSDLNYEDLITEEDMVVTLSHQGYIKAQPVSTYQPQRRGGKGRSMTTMRDEDYIDKLFVANSHDTLLCFTNYGKVYWLKVYELPQGSRISKGRPIVNILPLQADERLNAVLPIREFSAAHYVFMATAKGVVKKTLLSEFSNPRQSGIIAIGLNDNDRLIGVDITDGKKDVLLFSRKGKGVRFSEDDVRAMGRTAHGVGGIRLAENDEVIALLIADEDCTILTATEKGFGKRTRLDKYPQKGRYTQGVITIKVNERNGEVIGAVLVREKDDVILVNNRGILVRIKVEGISVLDRNTQGVTLIHLTGDERLVAIEPVKEIEGANAEDFHEESDDEVGDDVEPDTSTEMIPE